MGVCKLRIENSYIVTPCYTADASGVCSALFELGGMIVMHDPSGCNSTYNTHDETRWYDKDSLIYITGLTEIDAIMGNDKKVVEDVSDAAGRLKPAFITICGSPIPYLNGTDYNAIASMIEKRTGIPAFAVHTNSMHDYIVGGGTALKEYVSCMLKILQKRYGLNDIRNIKSAICDQSLSEHDKIYQQSSDKSDKNNRHVINILGASPLDFGDFRTINSIKQAFVNRDIDISTSFAFGSGDIRNGVDIDGILLPDLNADVNLVVSAMGVPLAKYLYEEFGTPYVLGVPTGKFAEVLSEDIKRAAAAGTCSTGYAKNSAGHRRKAGDAGKLEPGPCSKADPAREIDVAIIGEAVTMSSLAAAIRLQYGCNVKVLCPLEFSKSALTENDMAFKGEEQCMELLKGVKHVIADPLYRPLCPETAVFHGLPHVAFSGRCFIRDVKDLVTILDT